MRAQPEPRARNARELRLRPRLSGGGVLGRGSASLSSKFSRKFILETMHFGV